jgi:hypothetical protein
LPPRSAHSHDPPRSAPPPRHPPPRAGHPAAGQHHRAHRIHRVSPPEHPSARPTAARNATAATARAGGAPPCPSWPHRAPAQQAIRPHRLGGYAGGSCWYSKASTKGTVALLKPA